MNWQERAEKAEAELAKLREQEPVAWDCGGSITANSGYAEWFSRKDHGAAVPLYTSPVPAPAVPAGCVAHLAQLADDPCQCHCCRTKRRKARALLQSAPEAPENFRAAAVAYLESIDRFNTLNSTVGGGWSTKKAGTHQEIVLAANEMHGRRMLLESLLQSTPQSSSEPVAHHPV